MLKRIWDYLKMVICALASENEYERNYCKYARGYRKYKK